MPASDQISQGVSLDDLRLPASTQLPDHQRTATYVGIDFGTRTTAASVVRTSPAGGHVVEPIRFKQLYADGRTTTHHLVESCVAWHHKHGKLLVGKGAFDLRTTPGFEEGVNVWSSFKMLLGTDIGPDYPRSALRGEDGSPRIARARDCAKLFFEFLRHRIESHVKANRLPSDIRYALSVPAAFESNQRRDLLEAVEAAGIPRDAVVLIDEPNAAFLSFLLEKLNAEEDREGFIERLRTGAHIAVFDFGAGTCDISILAVRVDAESQRVTTKNLALSKFEPLGGDDIDRAIVWRRLKDELGKTLETDFTDRNLQEEVVPKLMPEAEQLKIQASKMCERRGLRTIEDIREASMNADDIVWTRPKPVRLKSKKGSASLRMQLTLLEFANVMEVFLSHETDDPNVKSVFRPLTNALKKADLDKSQLDFLIFIGGSSMNPLVREAVARWLGSDVQCFVPRDMRTHVSQGAALQSLLVHGLGTQLVQPITAEPIYVITQGDELEELLPAGTPVPTQEKVMTPLRIPKGGLHKIQIPICVSGREKLLSVIEVEPKQASQRFPENEEVCIHSWVDSDKVLRFEVRIANLDTISVQLDPLANTEITEEERAYLESKRAFRESVWRGRGRPTLAATLTLAHAAKNAGHFKEAADLYETAERLDRDRDFSVVITYCLARAGMEDASNQWAETAYERNPCDVSAYNLALARLDQCRQPEAEDLLRESLRHNPNYIPALRVLGKRLKSRGQPEGQRLLDQACDLLLARVERSLQAGSVDADDVRALRAVGEATGRSAVRPILSEAEQRLRADGVHPRYNDKNLLVGQMRLPRQEG